MEERKELQWFLTPQDAVTILVTEGLKHIDCSISATLENEMLRRKKKAKEQSTPRSLSMSYVIPRRTKGKSTFILLRAHTS